MHYDEPSVESILGGKKKRTMSVGGYNGGATASPVAVSPVNDRAATTPATATTTTTTTAAAARRRRQRGLLSSLSCSAVYSRVILLLLLLFLSILISLAEATTTEAQEEDRLLNDEQEDNKNNGGGGISTSDWVKGISLSVLASLIGGASKLSIRKSWIIQETIEKRERSRGAGPPYGHGEEGEEGHDDDEDEEGNSPFLSSPFVIVRSEDEDDDKNTGGDDDEPFTGAEEGGEEEEDPLSLNNNNVLEEEPVAGTANARRAEEATKKKNEIVIMDNMRRRSSDTINTTEDGRKSLTRRRDSRRTSRSRSSSPPPPPPLPPIVVEQPPISPLASSSLTMQLPIGQQSNSNPKPSSSLWCAYCLRGCGMIGMTFLNPLCGVLAMNYASPSITAPFSGLTLVWIVLFSKPVVDETPSCNQIIASSLIVIGEAIVAMFGDHTNDENVSVDDVVQSYKDPTFLLYFVVVSVWMITLWRWMMTEPTTSPTLRKFSWGVAGGSITGLQNFLKDALTTLKASKSSGGGSMPWILLIVFVLLAIFTAFSGLLFLTACMKRYDATYSSAMFVGSFVVSASIMSAIHYDTFQHLQDALNYIMYPFGLLVLMGGVYMLIQEANDDANNNADFVQVDNPRSPASMSSQTSSSQSRGHSLVPLHHQPDVEEPLFSDYYDHENDTTNPTTRGTLT